MGGRENENVNVIGPIFDDRFKETLSINCLSVCLSVCLYVHMQATEHTFRTRNLNFGVNDHWDI